MVFHNSYTITFTFTFYLYLCALQPKQPLKSLTWLYRYDGRFLVAIVMYIVYYSPSYTRSRSLRAGLNVAKCIGLYRLP